MNFNSIEFVVFLVVVLVAYHRLAHRPQNLLLLVASYVFYGWWDYRFLGLIVLSTGVDFVAGQRIADAGEDAQRRKWLLISVATNLGLLFTFKYFNWFADSLVALAGAAGWDVAPGGVLLRIALPVGISFYTFQTMSYTIDVYRGILTPTRSPLDFAVFVAFFPQLVAGPIERARHLLPQVSGERRVTADDVSEGTWLLFFGFFKKVVVADNLGRIATAVFDHPEVVQGWDVVIGTWAFAWQIYGDFSGYSDIARGCARLLGFDLMLNFRMPYFAVNPQEFWDRWHISLSTWLRDYLYVPLGGNRGGVRAMYRNLTLTMLLGGVWHGAAWHFVAWGAYQGALLVGHRALLGRVSLTDRKRPPAWTPGRILKAIGFFQLVCLGWVLFRVNGLGDLPLLWGRLTAGGITLGAPALAAFAVVLPLLGLHFVMARDDDEFVVLRWPVAARVGVYALLAGLIVVLGVRQGEQFIYFQF